MYTIHFLTIPPGKDALTTAREMTKDDFENEEEPFRKFNPVSIVAPLQKALPELQITDESTEVTDEERIVELSAPDAGTGVMIEAGESWAYFLVPPSRSGKTSEEIWTALWPCLEAMEFHTGLVAYDPQLDRILNTRSDMNDVIQKFQEVAPYSKHSTAAVPIPLSMRLLVIPVFLIGWAAIAFLTRGLPGYVTIIAAVLFFIAINISLKQWALSRQKKKTNQP